MTISLKMQALIAVFFVIIPATIVVVFYVPTMKTLEEATYQNGEVSGVVASCTYSWLDDSTSVMFSNVGLYRFVGNWNFGIGNNCTVTYQWRPPRGNFITNIELR